MRYRITSNITTQSVLRLYLGLVMQRGESHIYSESALVAMWTATAHGASWGAVRDFLAGEGCCNRVREANDPPVRYGPYRPIAKRLPA